MGDIKLDLVAGAQTEIERELLGRDGDPKLFPCELPEVSPVVLESKW
jgi:hypothetical protein